MAYEKFKAVMSKEDFFNSWHDKVEELTDALLDRIYQKYVLKCRVFQRDKFTCQNIKCQVCHNVPYFARLTIHHVKFRKNNGEDKERNTVTLCRGIHTGYHRAKAVLSFPNTPALPAHIRGHKFVLSRADEMDWKKIKFEMKQLRKNLKAQGFKPIITWEQIAIIMRFLFGEDKNGDD
jgi:hypothetical protein